MSRIDLQNHSLQSKALCHHFTLGYRQRVAQSADLSAQFGSCSVAHVDHESFYATQAHVKVSGREAARAYPHARQRKKAEKEYKKSNF
jgi:hypothetical protein